MYAQCATGCWEQTSDRTAEWLVHKAKVQLLHERVKARVEARYGKDLDGLADALLASVAENERESETTTQKSEALQEAFDKLFG